jgi:hypothetical protein
VKGIVYGKGGILMSKEYFCETCHLPWVVNLKDKDWYYGANLKPQTNKECPNCYQEDFK